MDRMVTGLTYICVKMGRNIINNIYIFQDNWLLNDDCVIIEAEICVFSREIQLISMLLIISGKQHVLKFYWKQMSILLLF